MGAFWLITLAVAAAGIAFMGSCLSRRRKKFPPGPYGLPLVGYLPFMGKHAPRAFMKEAKKYGPVFSVQIGRNTWVILADNDSIREGLVERGSDFSGRPFLHLFEAGTRGLGILFRDYGEIYNSQRKFAHIALRSLERTYAEEKITEEFGQFAKVILSKQEKAFDCQEALLNATCNILSSMFFGSRFSYGDTRLEKLTTILNVGFLDKSHSRNVSLLTFVPELRFLPPFSSTYRKVLNDVDTILDIIQSIIDEHKNSFGEDKPRDFISEYLKEIQMNGGKDESFHEKQLREIIREFFVGGTGTITGTLRWCMLCFTSYPHIQDKIFEEIDQIIGSETPTMGDKERLPYTNAFLQEIMRHRTAVPLGVPHAPTKDIRFRGYDIPKGTPILTCLWAAHFDSKHFPNAEEFNPERFIDSEGKFVKSKHVIPFAVGPRHCLGEELARMALFLLLVNIVKTFKIRPSAKGDLPDFNEGVVGNANVPFPFEVSFIPR